MKKAKAKAKKPAKAKKKTLKAKDLKKIAGGGVLDWW